MHIFIILARRIRNAWYINDYHRLATILHPKLKNFDFCRDEKQRSIDVLKQEYDKLELNNSLSQKIASNVLQSNNANSSQASTTETTPKRKNLLTQYFDSKHINQPQSSNSYQEIENYLNSDYSDIRHNEDGLDHIDVLSFWQENRHTFPQLAKLAKIICAIPASNTIVERLFSTAKYVITDKRTHLQSEKINQILFLQKNLKTLKQLSTHDVQRKRTVSMSSTATVSSEESTCTGLLEAPCAFLMLMMFENHTDGTLYC